MKKQSLSNHPAWALAHKRPGTELRLIRGNYYLYEYKTVYDKAKKGARKISGPIIGSITEKDGFIASAKRDLEKSVKSGNTFTGIQCKEFGVSRLIMDQFKVYNDVLQLVFPDEWKDILAIAYCRFVYRCPLKNIPFRLASGYLSDLLNLKPFSEKHSSGILNRIGSEREKILRYMKTFITPGEYLLMDATDIFSASEQIKLAQKGYNSSLQYDTQFNLMYIYSADSRMPVYYRLLAGNIREVKSFKNCLREAGLEKAVIIADKGFYSQTNLEMLLQEELLFILPLRRNNMLISYQDIKENTFKSGDSFFTHEQRPIWYKTYEMNNSDISINKPMKVFVYLDEQLRIKEEADYLRRIKTHPENYSIQEYHLRKDRFGTIALLSVLDENEEGTYQTYKSRMSIEVMFDSMKNVLDADHTYMQNEQTLQGWMFVNHITLQWYQHLYIELKEKKLLKQISVNDYIQLLTDVKKIKINNDWYLNEFTTQTQKLVDKLNIQII
jgi:hypothetical protein